MGDRVQTDILSFGNLFEADDDFHNRIDTKVVAKSKVLFSPSLSAED